jgi:hypothetical protein
MGKLTTKYLRADDADNLLEALRFADEQGHPTHRNAYVTPSTGAAMTSTGTGSGNAQVIPTILTCTRMIRSTMRV